MNLTEAKATRLAGVANPRGIGFEPMDGHVYLADDGNHRRSNPLNIFVRTSALQCARRLGIVPDVNLVQGSTSVLRFQVNRDLVSMHEHDMDPK